MLRETLPYWLANRPVAANTGLEVTDKYSGEVVTRVAKADADAIDRAITAGVAAVEPMRAMPAHRRQSVLEHCAARFTERSAELAEVLTIEAGKPIRDSRGEVTRLIDTFKIAAEEAVRIEGELAYLDRGERTTGYLSMFKHVPVGCCAFISPFNFPLNLVAHKVAPALATGCPFVLKPASLTPVGALLVGEVLAETDLPEGAFSILPCDRRVAAPLTTDERLALLSFTGSPEVGWGLKARAGRKKVVLELGGNAACIVEADADIEDTVRRIVVGAFYQSGQSCISVQRILVQESIYAELTECLVAATRGLVLGDPKDEATVLGPLISEAEAERVEAWITAALEHGAQLCCGGRRDGAMLDATLLARVPRDAKLWTEEAFGPVALLASYGDFDEALDLVNDSNFGLQVGVFTRDLYKAHRAWDRAEVGGVIVGDVPSFRADQMPYGGVKASGFGREGLRYAIRDMCELRLLVLRGV